MAAIEEIYNFRQLGPRLATGGQPTVEELYAICKAGFDTVINLGLADAPYALAQEQGIIESCGIGYVHIPVNFESPEPAAFDAFRERMKRLSHNRLFVHCAANKRVSVFVALYRVLEEDRSLEAVLQEVHSVWIPNAPWQAFIDGILQRHQAQG